MARLGSLPIEFAVTPRFDAFYALYTLGGKASGPLDLWKERATARLPRDFDRLSRRVAPLPIFWPLLADAIQGVPGEISFDEILSTIQAIPLEDLRTNILAGIFHERNTVDAIVAGEITLRQAVSRDDLPNGELLVAFGLRPYDGNSAAVRAMNTLITRPESFRDVLALLLERFWEAGFKEDWSTLEPKLRRESVRMQDLREKSSPAQLGHDLNFPITLDDVAHEATPRSGPAISYDRIDRCYVLPSAFNVRRLWTKYETTVGRITLYVPIMRGAELANQLVRADVPAVESTISDRPAINAETIFRALGDTTRYAIASILARTPTTSAELARSLNMSKPTITHHVQALRSAGLIAETPARGSTKLSLSRDTVAALSGAAVDQLFSSTGDLTLATTRKRRNA
ncbi:MAG: ArsR/SmtB family transcription factor [Gemmatimonadaceae bacterium]